MSGAKKTGEERAMKTGEVRDQRKQGRYGVYDAVQRAIVLEGGDGVEGRWRN